MAFHLAKTFVCAQYSQTIVTISETPLLTLLEGSWNIRDKTGQHSFSQDATDAIIFCCKYAMEKTMEKAGLKSDFQHSRESTVPFPSQNWC